MEHPGDLLSAYVDSALTDREATEVAAHLAECAACREAVADVRAVRRLLAAVPHPQPEPELLGRFLASAHQPPQARIGPWLVAAAAFVLVAPRIPQSPVTFPSLMDDLQDHARLTAHNPLREVGLDSFLSTLLSQPREEEP